MLPSSDPNPPSLQVTPPQDTSHPAAPTPPATLPTTRSASPLSTTYAPISPLPALHRPRFASVSYGGSSQPSIRIRRHPSSTFASQANIPIASSSDNEGPAVQNEGFGGGRRRSSSEPQRMFLSPQDGRGLTTRSSAGHMPNIVEGTSTANDGRSSPGQQSTPQVNPTLKRKSLSRLFRTRNDDESFISQEGQEYNEGLVDYLDLVDPEVSTLNTLTNVQNSLFIPDLGWLVNRRPTYTLTRRSTEADPLDASAVEPISEQPEAGAQVEGRIGRRRTQTATSITSRPGSHHYAVLPDGVALEGWSAEDRRELNDHVRHMLHSKRSKFKRSMKGFGQYLRRPLGFFVTLYATLITLFGLAWVLFLIGWINVGGRKHYIINIIDNVLVALFAIMGDGLAPFRAVDTYHMCFIAHYHHLTWRIREEQALPKLQNENDLPQLPPRDTDLEAGAKSEEEEYSVLTEKQQKRLVHHQNKFAKSHTFYKPHETTTHYAFPLRLLVAIVCLLDCHSFLQISLGLCTWAINYHHRPFALTTVILCCSITVNITAGIVIMIGDRRTRKNDVLEKMYKQELTAEAMVKVEKKREKERNKSKLLLEPVPPPVGAETSKPSPEDPDDLAKEREKTSSIHTSPTSSRNSRSPKNPKSPTSPTSPTSPVAREPLPIAKEGDGEMSGMIPVTLALPAPKRDL